MFCSTEAAEEGASADIVYLIMNAYWETASFELPRPPQPLRWHVAVNTAMMPPDDSYPPAHEIRLEDQNSMIVGARSVVILVAR